MLFLIQISVDKVLNNTYRENSRSVHEMATSVLLSADRRRRGEPHDRICSIGSLKMLSLVPTTITKAETVLQLDDRLRIVAEVTRILIELTRQHMCQRKPLTQKTVTTEISSLGARLFQTKLHFHTCSPGID